MILWFTGNSGAGKTTLAKNIISISGATNIVHLDGDDLREVWSLGFTDADRLEHNLRIARLAKLFESKGNHVLVSTVCPDFSHRQKIHTLVPQIIFVELRGGVDTMGKPYQEGRVS